MTDSHLSSEWVFTETPPTDFPVIRGIPAVPEQLPGVETRGKSGGSAVDCDPGRIWLQIASGHDVESIVADHAGVRSDIHPATSLPINDFARDAGIDRMFFIDVPVGTESERVRAYASDPRVQRATLLHNFRGGEGSLR